jgi:hypothetical protein
MFLPWHRYYLMVFERDLQVASGNPNLGLPYWSWELDSSDWYRPSKGILSPDAFGTSGFRTRDGCVRDGVFNARLTDGQCITRYYNPAGGNNGMGMTVLSEVAMEALLLTTNYRNFDGFRDAIENVPHGSIHVFVGAYESSSFDATGGTMVNIATSSKDLTFWLHHNNLDRWFKYRQKMNPANAYQYDGARRYPASSTQSGDRNRPARLTNIMPPFNVNVGVGMQFDMGDFCYRFQPPSRASIVVGPQYASILLRKRGDVPSTAANNSSNTTIVVTTPNDPLPVLQKEPPSQVTDMLERFTFATNTKNSKIAPQNHFEPPPPRDTPTPLDARWLRSMGYDVEAFRNKEKEVVEKVEQVYKVTDEVLEKYFGTSYNETNFVVNAAATKLALAHIATGTEVPKE